MRENEFRPDRLPGPNPEIFDPNKVWLELDIMEVMHNQEIMNRIVEFSNCYGREKHNESMAINHPAWEDISEGDIRLFDACLMYFGIVKRPKMQDYWSRGWFEGTSPTRNLMSRNRFFTILRSLAFTDQQSLPNSGDKLYRCRDLIDTLNKNYADNYYPQQGLSVDETLIKYSGNKTCYKVKINTKAARVGIKMYKINEATTGYCLRTETYSNSQGDKWKTNKFQNFDVRDCTQPAKIVLMLIEPYLGYGHTVGVDSFYTEPRLFRILLEQNTNCVGVLKDRKYIHPTAYLKQLGLMNTGEIKSWFSRPIGNNNGLQLLAWQDQKMVRVLTSFHDKDQYESEEDTLARQRRLHNDDIQRKPSAVIDYKKYMPGIDKQDQMKSYYSAMRLKIKRPHKLLYMEHLETSLFNSFIIFRHLMQGKLKSTYNYLEFKRNIFIQTFTKYRPSIAHRIIHVQQPLVPAMPDLPVPDEVRFDLTLNHMPIKIGLDNQGRRRSKDCEVCSRVCKHDAEGEKCGGRCPDRNKRRRIAYYCSICRKHLCIDAEDETGSPLNCFQIYHLRDAENMVSLIIIIKC